MSRPFGSKNKSTIAREQGLVPPQSTTAQAQVAGAQMPQVQPTPQQPVVQAAAPAVPQTQPAPNVMQGAPADTAAQTMAAAQAQQMPAAGMQAGTMQQGDRLNDDVTQSTDQQAEAVAEEKQQKFDTLDQASDAFGKMFSDAVNTPEVDKEVEENPILEATSGTPSPVPNMEIINADGTETDTGLDTLDDTGEGPASNDDEPEQAPQSEVQNGDTPDMSAEIAQIKAMIGDLKSGNPQGISAIPGAEPIQEEPPEPEKSPEEQLKEYIDSDEFYDKFAENPGQAILDVASRISDSREGQLTDRLRPLLDQADQIRERNRTVDAINKFVAMGNGRYDDFGDHIDGITNIIRNEGLDINDPLSYENAYGRVKASDLQRQLDEANAKRGRTLEDYLQDEDSVNKMASNEGIRSKVITDYLKSLDEGAAPQVINNSGEQAPAATPANKIDNFRDAGDAFSKLINGR